MITSPVTICHTLTRMFEGRVYGIYGKLRVEATYICLSAHINRTMVGGMIIVHRFIIHTRPYMYR